MTLNDEKKNFYSKMIVIGVPVVFQNLISLGLNLIDTLMIGMLGEKELAAVGAANQIYFIFTVSLFGLFSGAAVYTAQYWGAKDIKGVRKMLGIDYMVGVIFSLLVTVLAFTFANGIIGLFTDDPEVVELGASYLKIASLSYTFSALTYSITYNSRAIQNLLVPTIINAIALILNAVLNYLLIFGVGNFPELGVRGAAVATLTARICEFCAVMTYIYTRKEHPFKTGFANLFGFDKELFIKVMKTAIPVVLTEGGWAASVALIFAAYGMLGTASLAVAQVTNVVTELLQSVYFGVGNATAMIIGETLGQRNKERAYRYASESLKIVWILNIVMTIFMLIIAKPVASLYNFSGETNILLVKSLMMMAVMLTSRMFGYIYIAGILRAGGDTVFSMKTEVFCNVCIHLPLAYFAVLVLHTTIPFAIMIVEMGNIVRIGMCVPRFKSKKWINIMTE